MCVYTYTYNYMYQFDKLGKLSHLAIISTYAVYKPFNSA